MKAPVEFNPLGELPAGWSWQPLQNLTANPKQDVVDGPFGSDLKASEYVTAGVPIARLQNIDRNSFVTKNIRYLTPEKAADLSRHEFRPNDILITKLGDPLGKACIVPVSIGRGVIVADLVRVRPDESRVDRQYLTYAINSPSIIKQFELHTKGTTRPRVNLSVLRQLPIPVAPREVQGEIVAELEKQFSRLDEAVANLQRVKANLKRYKASILKAAVEGRLVETEASLAHREGRTYETGEQLLRSALIARRAKWDRRGQYVEPKATASDELPSLPVGWVWANVEQLGFVRGGKRLPAGHKYAEEVTPHPYIRVTDFADYGINLDGLLYLKPETHKEIQRYTISSDDLYISIAGSIGLVGVLPARLSGSNLTENAAKITGLEQVQKEYLMYWLSSASGIDFISDSTIATTQAKLALYRIERIPVPLPPLAEQARIVAEVDRHLSILREVEAEVDANLQRAQALRQATLARAFSGTSAA